MDKETSHSKEKQAIVVLLSTYNAQEYLREQLDSLKQQDIPLLQVLVRDDGSTDHTIAILQEYEKDWDCLHYYQGENLGAIGSFFDLMQHVKDQSYAYIAFCDQDDVWLPDKLRTAVETIDQSAGTADTPVLYCSKTQLVDETLTVLEDHIRRTIRPSFSNALVENIVTGCTTVLNAAMYRILLQHIPRYCIMHDWWMYLIASCYGQVIYDSVPHILYRQHGNNVMGIERSYTKEMKARAKKFESRRSNICIQAEEFLRQTEAQESETVKQCRKKAALLAHYKDRMRNRLQLVFGHVVVRQRRMDDLIFRILFLLGLR